MHHPSHGGRHHLSRGRTLLPLCLCAAALALLCLNAPAAYRAARGGRARGRNTVGGHLGLPSRLAALQQPASRPHRLAVVVPYRGREEQLRRMLAVTAECIQRGTPGVAFDIFVIEQSPRRGPLEP